MELLHSYKKNRTLLSVTTWIDLEGVMLSEISQTENKYCMIFTYMWNLKKKKLTSITEQKESGKR